MSFNSSHYKLIILFSISGLLKADPIAIHSAEWGYGNSWCNVTHKIRIYCSGLDFCEDYAIKSSFPECNNQSHDNIYSLKIVYSCQNNTYKENIRELLNWKLSCPVSSQPNALTDFKIKRDASCDSASNFVIMQLPVGYYYCWHKKWDFKTMGVTKSDVTKIFSSPNSRNAIRVDWSVSPQGFPCPIMFGRGAINHLWVVAGAKVDEECPPNP
jgi:hypothetical protein